MLKLNLGLFMFFFMLMFCFISMFLGILFLVNDMIYFYEFVFFSLNSVIVSMSILLDWMSLIFISVVLGISCLVIFYSVEYMSSDLNINRFFYLVFGFVLSMLFLIVSPNMISILLGWDGLGLISYCLVVYYQNYKSYNAGMLTALVNRIGDVCLLICISWMMNFGSWYYFFYLFKLNEFGLIFFMIIFASFTKSAQIPFSSWLPAAMAAPTPVSALVHSSTLVTAGVYLLIRFNFFIFDFICVDYFILLSLLTMLMSSLCAIYEFDLKSIIALSTLSQLGFMMSVLLIGFPLLSFFHLLIHALFKAMLFLCAGVIIHCSWGNQDIRLMGGMSIQLPFISSCLNISNLCLCGFPFLSGFYSKDLILEMLMMSSMNFFVFVLFIISVSLTMIYSFRLTYYSLLKTYSGFSYLLLSDNCMKMSFSIFFMTLFSIFGGSILSWIIFSSPMLIFLPFSLSILTLLFLLIGVWLGYEFLYLFKFKSDLMFFYVGSMWFLPGFSTYFLVNNFMILSSIYLKLIEYSWGEYYGPRGLMSFFIDSSKFINYFQFNNFSVYMIMFIFWFLLLLILI